VGPCPIILEQERDTNWGDYPDNASDIFEDLDDYSSTQEYDYLIRFRRKGVGFVKWEGDDIETSETHEPTKEIIHVFPLMICLSLQRKSSIKYNGQRRKSMNKS
jgi:hypothetical protein